MYEYIYVYVRWLLHFIIKILLSEDLLVWHRALFPDSYSGLHRIINVCSLRNDSQGPKQVISGECGRDWVHFTAPSAEQCLALLYYVRANFNSTQ